MTNGVLPKSRYMTRLVSKVICLCTVALLILSSVQAQQKSHVRKKIKCALQRSGRYKLWYNQPAKNWNEALPLGNGFIGGMVFGDVQKTNAIQLNESTIWAGGPNNTIDSNARPYINQVRQLLAEKKYA
jgi:alpha-L-fucosidase 2